MAATMVGRVTMAVAEEWAVAAAEVSEDLVEGGVGLECVGHNHHNRYRNCNMTLQHRTHHQHRSHRGWQRQ